MIAAALLAANCIGPSLDHHARVLGAARAVAAKLIEPVAQRPSIELRAALDLLSGAGLLFCRGVAPQSSYLFKHALVQDAAYGTLLRAKRQELHARVAAVVSAGSHGAMILMLGSALITAISSCV